MNQEIRKEWVAALRSGEYKQGKSALRREDAFCCLGVLCDLHAKKTSSGGWRWESYSISGPNTYLGGATALPHEVMVWAGLSEGESNDRLGSVKDFALPNGVINLAQCNDGLELDFLAIADIIEKIPGQSRAEEG